jgi:hypothetical protein
MVNQQGKVAAASAVFIGLGSACIALSVFLEMQVLAFIGLGLTFWGAIFAFTRIGNVVESSLLDNTAKSNYSTLNRIMNDYKFTAKGYYLPAYPSDVSLPNYLANLKESVVFITNEEYNGPPFVDDILKNKFISTKSNGVFITSPGYDLLTSFESELKVDFTQIKSTDLFEVLPRSIIEANLAKTVKIKTLEGNLVSMEVSPVLYKSLYEKGEGFRAVDVLGCPVVSAVACALAKNFAKAVAIRELKFSGESSLRLEVLFEVLQG